MLRSMVVGILEIQGYKVHSAGTGEEALALWSEHRHSLRVLITDMLLPDGWNGQKLAARLLSDRPDLKVIFCSGFSSEELTDIHQELVAGDNFLQKPYTTQDLVKTVQRSLYVAC